MARMERIGAKGQNGPHGMGLVPTMHEAFHGHSRPKPHAKWVWITKSSIVDQEGNLGFLALEEGTRKFGARARKVFI
jgi:hypothetical protein